MNRLLMAATSQCIKHLMKVRFFKLLYIPHSHMGRPLFNPYGDYSHCAPYGAYSDYYWGGGSVGIGLVVGTS